MKTSKGKHFLHFYFAAWFSLFPSFANAKPITMTIVEVIHRNSSPELSDMRHKIENFLINHGTSLQLLSTDKVRSYFADDPHSYSTENLTEGDALYQQAEGYYMAFKTAEGWATVNKSIEVLERKPGVRGSLVKAYLMKTLLGWDLGKNSDALSALRLAVMANLGQKELDPYLYSPKLRGIYGKIHSDIMASMKNIEMEISVKGRGHVPIFINGVYRGQGPNLVVTVPANHPQLISAGGSHDAPVIKTIQKSTEIKAKGNGLSNLIGIEWASSPTMAHQAQKLGNALKSDRVLLMGMENGKGLDFMLVDAHSGHFTPSKTIQFQNIANDGDRVAMEMSRYIMGLSTAEFSVKKYARNKWQDDGNKKSSTRSRSKLGFILGGSAVLLGGIVAALAMGGKEHDANHTVSVSVSGATPGMY